MRFLAAFAIALMFTALTACVTGTEPDNVYEFEEFGFSIAMPSAWEGMYWLIERTPHRDECYQLFTLL